MTRLAPYFDVPDKGGSAPTPEPTPTPEPKAAASEPSKAPTPEPKADPSIELRRRITEETTARQDVERRLETLQDQHTTQQERIRALMGLEKPADPRIEQVRQEFLQVFPEYQQLSELAAALQQSGMTPQQFMQHFGELNASADYQWRIFGQSMVRTASDAVRTAFGLGGDVKLPDKTTRMINSMFREFAQDEANRDRYLNNDPTLAEDFAKDVLDAITPFRTQHLTQQAQQATSRAKLPRGGSEGAPITNVEKPDGPKSTREAASRMLEYMKTPA